MSVEGSKVFRKLEDILLKDFAGLLNFERPSLLSQFSTRSVRIVRVFMKSMFDFPLTNDPTFESFQIVNDASETPFYRLAQHKK
jgi:hypothetical protein